MAVHALTFSTLSICDTDNIHSINMSKVLKLYNSFTRSLNPAAMSSGREISLQRGVNPMFGSFYICGPTVHSESHLGHALTYIRADIFRRLMKSMFNIRLITVMNITDIDDKILLRASELISEGQNKEIMFRVVSENYYKSFVDDMNFIRVQKPDLTIKVADQIDLIANYIRHLERHGHAYIAKNKDVYFRVSSLKNYMGREDRRKLIEAEFLYSKEDTKDFALWKAAKPGEPTWIYKSDVTGEEVAGRPGWHVQCSAISSAVFGNRLDFHYGGKDLIFPHHYNEQACCCAYHDLDTSHSLNVWSRNWLHSGHLVVRDEKMSKSIGNVVGIRKFIKDSSVNALRLLCVNFHYRSDINYSGDLLEKMTSLDHKINAFINYLRDKLRQVGREDLSIGSDSGDHLKLSIEKVHNEISEGICDDLDLNRGLNAILNLAKYVYSLGSTAINCCDLVMTWCLLIEWCDICGLEYRSTKDSSDEDIINLLQEFRQSVRLSAINGMQRRKESETATDDSLVKILKNCDELRAKMDELGLIIRDKKAD